MSGFADRLNERQKGYKKVTDADEARRKREDAAVQLRKQAKDEALMKKRMVGENAGAEGSNPFASPLGAPQDAMAQVEPTAGANAHVVEQMPNMVQTLMSGDFDAVFGATQQFRKWLSVEQNPPIAEVINAGIVPRFVALLQEVGQPQLQFEAAWVLTNIASGTADQTRIVVEHGALPLFVELLKSPNEDVREQAVWALGNIAGDGPSYRDLVLQSGGIEPMQQLFTTTTKISLVRNATWALSNLCRGKPPPPLEWVMPAIPTFANLISSTDVEVLTDACWALSYLTDGSNDRIAAVLQSGITTRLVELLSHQSPLVQTPTLRAVGNIVTGDDQQTQAVLQCGALVPIKQLLSHAKKAIRKESCWALSNITAGNKEQIQAVLQSDLIPSVLELLSTGDFDVKKEAAWVISNATAGGSPQQIEFLVGCGCIKPLSDLLQTSDSKILSVALDALENILRVGKEKQAENGLAENPIVALVEQADGLSRIEALQEDSSEEIYEKAVRVLQTYFPLEEDNLDEVGAGGDMSASAGGFNFGAAMPQGGFNFGS